VEANKSWRRAERKPSGKHLRENVKEGGEEDFQYTFSQILLKRERGKKETWCRSANNSSSQGAQNSDTRGTPDIKGIKRSFIFLSPVKP
jgi:hypothetical protein